MKQKPLLILWGALFILCAGMGFIHGPEGALRILMIALALAFFAVGWLILYRAGKENDRHGMRLIRDLSAFSLGLTVLMLVCNFLSLAASETMGTLVYYILVIVSAPMVCGQYWAISLFLWACLLLTAQTWLKEKK